MKRLILATTVLMGVLAANAAKVASVAVKYPDGGTEGLGDAWAQCQVKAGDEYDPSQCSRDVGALRATGAFDNITVDVKESVDRLRPYYTAGLLERGLHWPLNRSSFFGFFSGHASNAFGFAACSFLGFRLNDRRYRYAAYGWCVFIWAALVALSRVMMAAHFFGDILVGTLFGLAVGTLCASLARGVIRKWLEPATT